MNLNLTPEFERDLKQFMRARGITNKSEAIRIAVREGVASKTNAADRDFESLLGSIKPVKRSRKFKSEDDLWK